MPVRIEFAQTPDEFPGLVELTRRYLEWDLAEFEKVSGIYLSVDDWPDQCP